jgi:hypothetical protein
MKPGGRTWTEQDKLMSDVARRRDRSPAGSPKLVEFWRCRTSHLGHQ